MIDLRSDTLTLPSCKMLEGILSAPLGDDGRVNQEGRGEDPSVRLLEDTAAGIFAKEAAVFFPSGTMANTAALLTWAQPGQMVLIEPLLHIVRSEKAAFSPRLGQLSPLTYSVDEEGKPDLDRLLPMLTQKPMLMLLENSHNFRGGLCLSAEETDRLCDAAHAQGVRVHIDGARIFNAAAHHRVSVSRLSKGADSLMFCLSKGLGAPIGSLVVCSSEFAVRLRETRKLLGGTLRQAGIAAAPGLYALQHQQNNAQHDNDHALLFCKRLVKLNKLSIPHKVQSNIVMLNTEKTGMSPDAFCELCYQHRLYIRPVLESKVRLVFHMDINREQTLEAADIINRIDSSL